MARLARRVLSYHAGGSSYRDYRWDLVSTLAYAAFEVDPATGNARDLHGWNSTPLIADAHASGATAVLVAQLFTAAACRAFLPSTKKRAALIQGLVKAVQDRHADGVNVDFEGVPADQRANLTTFFHELAAAFRTALPKVEISAALPAIDFAHAYDLAAIDALCDSVLLMAYDYAWRTAPNAGPVAPLGGGPYNVAASAHTYLKAGVRADRLLLGVPYYGYDWPTESTDPRSKTTGPATAHGYAHHVDAAAAYTRGFDRDAQSPWYCYKARDQPHVCWYEDAASLAAKYATVNSLGLAGIGIWTVAQGDNRPELWQAIESAFTVPA
jgi:spore germination protein YaaH